MAVTIDDLIVKARDYLSPDKVDLVRAAYGYAEQAHREQKRLSGLPYIQHPVAVALVLAELRLDGSTIASALLHDVVEDTGITESELAEAFGLEVASLVDGVTKLGRIETKAAVGTSEAQYRLSRNNESLRKMLVAMAEDVRVILIKLADRLHNMRTLEPLPPQKRIRIAQETLEIYAPLAQRLGISSVQWQLEDLAFRTLQPDKYKEISRLLATSRTRREAFMKQVVGGLDHELQSAGISAEVTGRAKNIYSIYDKMQRYGNVGRDFDQIYDLIAVRIVVEDIRACYAVLGVVHSMWHPIRGEFDDYIANPRENMYQSLHTSVLGPNVSPFEVQIRTYRMHEIAEYGVAAHWRYKQGQGDDGRFEDQMSWMRQLLEWHRDEDGSDDFVESVKSDIFKDQVFVYTPKSEVRELPAGATPIDFAYMIHTNLGHDCAGAKISGKIAALDYELQSGDTVEILIRSGKGPSLDWLNPDLGYVQTAHARSKIKQWFRKRARVDNVEHGRDLLVKELHRLHVSFADEDIAEIFSYESVDDLFVALGSGGLSTHQLAVGLLPPPEQHMLDLKPNAFADSVPAVRVMGMNGLYTRLAGCCSPVVGQAIIGFVTRLRGVTVHRKGCRTLGSDASTDRLLEVEWGVAPGNYPATITIEGWDRIGMLRDITTVVSSEKVNITAIESTHHKDETVTERLAVQTRDAGQLRRILSKLEGIKDIISVRRLG